MSEHGAVVLIGPMGAGKSSIGRKVARILGVSFHDTDSLIAREHGPIPALFEAHGEAHFRAVERESVKQALLAGGVVALGGGAVLDHDTRADLAQHRVVLLAVEERVVAGRLSGGAGRPLLAGGEDPMERWLRIREERWPVYQSVANIEFDTSRGHVQDIARSIAEWAEKENA